MSDQPPVTYSLEDLHREFAGAVSLGQLRGFIRSGDLIANNVAKHEQRPKWVISAAARRDFIEKWNLGKRSPRKPGRRG